ncbi:MAG TPA: DUF4411 family protein, partial [Acidobacteriaceae bacterium]|nr:DUF4411 family protein [Acidobacteriaceae bacterium]
RSRRGNGFCISPEKTVQKAYGLVVDHVQNNYRSHHAAKFLSVADPWIIAHALDSKGVVVTFEKKQPGANCVKIPNVCGSLGVPFMNLYDMLVALGITFA